MLTSKSFPADTLNTAGYDNPLNQQQYLALLDTSICKFNLLSAWKDWSSNPCHAGDLILRITSEHAGRPDPPVLPPFLQPPELG